MTTPGAGVGLDGITAEALRAGRAAWWDAEFDRLLLGALPETTRLLADVGCGLGHAALALLPARPALRWVGIDADGGRLAQARDLVAAAGLERRTGLVRARAEALPFGAGALDAALFVATIQHLPDPAAALAEARRALRPAGRLVAVEPDNLVQHFWLDGPLPAVDAAFSNLYRRAREARLPADLAVGPRVPALVRAAGFEVVDVRVHGIQVMRWEAPAAWRARQGELVSTIAGASGLGDSGEAAACQAALDGAVASAGGVGERCAAHLVPMFRVVAVAPA